jgi:ABC-type multidrug transport system fused ATPase/permease subunit
MKLSIKEILNSIHFTGSVSSISSFITPEIIATIFTAIVSIIPLFIVNSLVSSILIVVVILLVIIFVRIRNIISKYDKLEKIYNECKKNSNEYNKLKKEHNNFKSELCFFINKCHIFQNGGNILACYLDQENAYFTDDTSEVNNAIEKCKACAEYFKQSHTQGITRLESEINDYSKRLNKQNFNVFIDFCEEDKEFGDAIQEYLEDQEIHCSLIGNNLPNLSKLLDKNTIIIVLYYNAPESWLQGRVSGYKHSTNKHFRETNRKQIDLFTCSKNEQPSAIRLPKYMKWQCGVVFSPEDCLNKIELIK